MIPSQYLKQIEDRIVGMRQRPKVGVFIDLDGVLADKDDLQDETIAGTIWEFGCSIGRLCQTAVYYSTDIVSSDGIDGRAWSKRAFKKVHTQEEGFTKEDLNLDLMFDAHAASMRGRFDTAILVVGRADYNKLAQRLVHEGASVIMVSNYPREKRILPRHSCIYVPLYTLFGPSREDAVESEVDPEELDYASLIRLLATSEDMMPFVAVSYFVKRVMWRLGDEFQEYRLCQKVFQAAKDLGIIEVYERENINNSGNMVSACRLNQEHHLVVEVMEKLEEATHARDGVQVTVDIGNSSNGNSGSSNDLRINV
jgi:hypothetical protein